MQTIVAAGIRAASAGRAVGRALAAFPTSVLLSTPIHAIAAGKAAASMIATVARDERVRLRSALAVGTHRTEELPATVHWVEGSHPLPDQRSVGGGTRAARIARDARAGEALWLLLSGGASSLLSLPARGVSLDDKRRTIELMMERGADVHALNTVRKHLSSIKGGQLAAMCRGSTLTLAVSDVNDDDPSVIGSGPGVPDPSTWTDAADALRAYGGDLHPDTVRRRIQTGLRGEIADTPKPGDRRMRSASAAVIASRREMLDGARAAAESLGYRAVVREAALAGEARRTAGPWLDEALLATADSRPVCFLSAGETTVVVTGRGRGGRNQEFALALVPLIASSRNVLVAASVGSDGIDGPTDAAGAIVARDTMARAGAAGLAAPVRYLDDNDSYAYFDRLGDLVRTGRTDTNVGDLQVLLRR